MNSDAAMIIKLWETVQNYVVESRRDELIESMLGVFEEHGLYPDEMSEDLRGCDPYLDNAMDNLYGEIEEDDYEEDE